MSGDVRKDVDSEYKKDDSGICGHLDVMDGESGGMKRMIEEEKRETGGQVLRKGG